MEVPDSNLHNSKNNSKHRQSIAKRLDEIARDCLKRGFFGQAMITVTIQDGEIQEIEKHVNQKHRLS
jgi:hypothetical protein